MPTYLDRDVSGDGSDVFPGAEVLYCVLHVTTVGAEARPAEAGSSDHFLRLGWLSFGDNLAVIGGAADYWREPIWINYLRQLWTPVPSSNTPNALGLVATRLRWHLSFGTAAHVYVFGR